ncbi:MAG: ATPase [Spirochaetales bacterium]|nr:ATPase [Spirochaetales bacterium]
MSHPKEKFKKRVGLSLIITVLVLLFIGVINGPALLAQTHETTEKAALGTNEAEVAKFALMAAAAAFGLGAIGAGLAIGNVGAAAMGAIGEKPEIAGQALIFIALAEGLVVFGFITALMILGNIPQ